MSETSQQRLLPQQRPVWKIVAVVAGVACVACILGGGVLIFSRQDGEKSTVSAKTKLAQGTPSFDGLFNGDAKEYNSGKIRLYALEERERFTKDKNGKSSKSDSYGSKSSKNKSSKSHSSKSSKTADVTLAPTISSKPTLSPALIEKGPKEDSTGSTSKSAKAAPKSSKGYSKSGKVFSKSSKADSKSSKTESDKGGYESNDEEDDGITVTPTFSPTLSPTFLSLPTSSPVPTLSPTSSARPTLSSEPTHAPVTPVPYPWTQLGSDIDGEAADDFSGGAVSLSNDGSTVAIGAYGNDDTGNMAGHVRVFKWNGSDWPQLGSDIDGKSDDALSGYSVSLSGDGNTVAIGAPYYNDGNTGYVQVHRMIGSDWAQVGSDIEGEKANDFLGRSVSLSNDGNTVAIGTSYNDESLAGRVQVFELNGSVWAQRGSNIYGKLASDMLGWSVSLSGDGSTIAVGAPFNGNKKVRKPGHVEVFEWSGSDWVQLGSNIDGEFDADFFGQSVSLSNDGSTLAIGAPQNDDNGDNSGHVRVYKWNGSDWSKLGSDINGKAAGDWLGESISLSNDGMTLAVGAPYNDAGHVQVFKWNGSNWAQLGFDIEGETAHDQSGYSVSLSGEGSTVAVGAWTNDGSNRSFSGHVRIYS